MSVSLKRSPFPEVRPAELAQQLKGHQKVRDKVPEWYGKPGMYFPPSLNLEQASSQVTALYKTRLAQGAYLMDITGGFGVDTFFLSKNFDHTDSYERDEELAEIVAHNFQNLGANNVQVHAGDGMEALRQRMDHKELADWVYSDPSRRHERKGKVIRLEDYQPDIPSNLSWIRKCCKNLLVKTSPMMDLNAGVEALSPVREVHIVAVRNEVRELLWWIDPSWSGGLRIVSADLYPEKEWILDFTREETASASCQYGQPQAYLYEPNAALMKVGAFEWIGQHFELQKLHKNTHLFTSDRKLDFPGRRFSIRDVIPYKPGRLPFGQGNVSARNFPESVDLIRKRNRIRPGGSDYLFFVRHADERLYVVHCEKV